MSYKQVEQAREIRLWIGQIVVPVLGVTAMIMSNPESRYFVARKIDDVKWSIKKKFRKN